MRSYHRAVALLALGLTLNGCMAWKPQEGGAAAAIARNQPKWARQRQSPGPV
jgi:hypothetical protein